MTGALCPPSMAHSAPAMPAAFSLGEANERPCLRTRGGDASIAKISLCYHAWSASLRKKILDREVLRRYTTDRQ